MWLAGALLAAITGLAPSGEAAIVQTGSATATAASGPAAITHGLTINSGDVIVALIAANNVGNTMTDNNGANPFAEAIQEDIPTGGSMRYSIFYRVAGASEPASYTWTLGSSQDWTIVMLVFSGVDTGAVWDVAPSVSTRGFNSGSGTATAPSMNTATAGAVGIMAVFSDAAGITFSSPTNGYGPLVQLGTNRSVAAAVRTWTTAGATGAASATLSLSNDWTAHQVALKPAAPGTLTPIYYSVGADGAALFSGNASATAGALTLASPAGNKVGVGDEVRVGANRYYITGRSSPTQFSIQGSAANGGSPGSSSITFASTAITIFRAFNLLSTAVSGSLDPNHLNTANLVAANFQLNWSLYNDAPLNNGNVQIDGYTTDATHYIRAFTPTPPSQVGSRQRHLGKAGTGFRMIPVVTPGGSYSVIQISDDHVRIEGIEIDGSRITGSINWVYGIRVSAAPAVAPTADIRIDKVLIHDLSTAPGADDKDVAAIFVQEGSVRVSNSILYRLHNSAINGASGSTPDTWGVHLESGATGGYVHNVTVYDLKNLVDSGLSVNVNGINNSSPSLTVRNAVVLDALDLAGPDPCFSGSYSGASSNNVSSDGTAPGTGSVFNRTSYASYFRSAVAGAEDLHIVGDGLAVWGANGIDLSADANLPVADDVDGEARAATPDIGADEFSSISGPRMRVKSGKYQGNGAAGRAIYVGFQPDVVFVKRVGGAPDVNAVLKTSLMGANTKSLDNAGIALAGNMVQSLDPTGFTVGSDASVNQATGGTCGVACDYYWVAFKAAAGYLKVGSYSGDGATVRSITGVGFEPDYVIVMPPGAGDPAGMPVWTASTFPAGDSFDFDATYRAPGAITGMESDGFQVGRGNVVVPYRAPDLNAGGSTYHYVAWNAVPGYTAVGTYLGNGLDNQSKNLVGFFPEWVLVKKDDIDQGANGERAVTHKPASTGTNNETVGGLRFAEIPPALDTIQKLLPLGFEIGLDERVNSNTDATCRGGFAPLCTYHYVAFGPHEPEGNFRSIGDTAAANWYGTSDTLGNGSSVTATQGGTLVSCAGTCQWLTANRGRGDVILIDLVPYTVARVTAENQLLLTSPYLGPSTGGKSYSIRRQYATLQAWENCISFNNDGGAGPGSDACSYFPVTSVSLVDDDRAEVGIVYKDFVYTAGVRINGTSSNSNTDATHSITLTADHGNRHYGIPGAGVVIDNSGNPTSAIEVFDDYVTVEWMEIQGGGATPWGIEVNGISAGSGATGASRLLLRNNLIHVPGFGIALTDPDVVADVYNNIIYNGSVGIRISPATLATWSEIRVMSNTIYNFTGSGFDSSVAAAGNPDRITLINNLAADEIPVQAGFVANSFAVNGASRNNMAGNPTASDASATSASPGGGAQPNQQLNTQIRFVNTAAFNLHIQQTSTAVNTGANLSGLFNIDIDSGIRQTPWDIGADDASATTVVKLQSFEARGLDSAVALDWRTASELDNLGFHLYRAPSADGPWTRLTSSPIPGLGSSAVGQAYSYRDGGLVNGTVYFYRLEDVDTSSKTTSHGPVSAVPEAGMAGDDEGGTGDSGGGKKDADAASGCPGWVLAAYGSSGGAEAVGALRCTRHGDPEAVSLSELRRDSRSATLELRTGGFYALHEPAGTVRVFVPGFDFAQDERTSALPFRRALVEAVVGRRVELAGVRATDVVGFRGLVPSALGKAEMEVDFDGTVRASRRNAQRRAVVRRGGSRSVPDDLVKLLPSQFQGEKKSAVVEISPLRYDEQRRQLVLATTVRLRLAFAGREPGESGRGSFGRAPRKRKPEVTGEVLARLFTTSLGLHAVPFEELFPGQGRGVPLSTLRLEKQGEAVGFHVEPATGGFGPGGRLYFHADETAASTDYSGEVAYELVSSREGVQMPLASAAPGSNVLVTPSQVTRTYETNRFYQPGLLQAEDLWLGDALASGATRVQAFTLAGVDPSGSAALGVFLQGASESGGPVDHHVSVSLNGVLVGEARFAGKKPYRISVSVQASLLREGANELQLTNVADTGVSSLVFVDRYEVSHAQASQLAGGRFEGTWGESGTATLAGATGAVALIDATQAPRWLTGYSASGGAVSFAAEAGRRYLAVGQEALLSPRVTQAQPSGLRSAGNQADYLLIAPRAFLPAASPLLQRRQDQGLATKAVAFEEIAESFGHGRPSAEAIREFLSYAYQSWQRPSPRYVLLLGDSSYDPRNFTGTSLPSPLPALWTKTSYLWTASDPLLGAVNGEDSLPDLAIGRLPATTLAQAETLVQKLVAWEDSGQGLAGRATLVADNPDLAGDFEADVEDIRASFLSDREVQVLKLSELGAAMRPSVLQALNGGLSYLGYVGHGGAAVWASENVWNSWDAPSLQAQSQQPLLVTMNCLNGYFVAPSYESLSESLLKAEGRGAVASFSPSGLSLDGPAHRYHRALVAELVSGRHERLGDAVLAAQQTYAESGLMPELLGIYHLLGDPALTIR